MLGTMEKYVVVAGGKATRPSPQNGKDCAEPLTRVILRFFFYGEQKVKASQKPDKSDYEVS